MDRSKEQLMKELAFELYNLSARIISIFWDTDREEHERIEALKKIPKRI